MSTSHGDDAAAAADVASVEAGPVATVRSDATAGTAGAQVDAGVGLDVDPSAGLDVDLDADLDLGDDLVDEQQHQELHQEHLQQADATALEPQTVAAGIPEITFAEASSADHADASAGIVEAASATPSAQDMASAAGSDPAQRQQTLLLQPPSAAKPKRQRPPRTPKDPNAPPSAKRQRAKPARTDGSGSSRGYGGIGLPSETGSIISMAEAAGSVSVSVSMSAAVSSTSRGVTDAAAGASRKRKRDGAMDRSPTPSQDALASSHRSRPAAQHLLPSSSLVGQHRRAPSAGDHDLDDLLVWSSAEDEDDGVSAAGSGPGFRAKYKALQKDMKGLAHRKQIVEANYRHFKSKLRRLKMEKNFLIDSLMRLHPSQ